MPLHWRPVGPEAESTYWLRRAVLAVGVVLLLVLLTTLVGGGDDPDTLAGDASPSPSPVAGPTTSPTASPSGTASPTASPRGTASPSASPGATPTSSPGGRCDPDALTIEPAADQDSYSVGSSPRLSLTVANTGSTPCTLDLGQAQVELVVTSGGDRIWSSDDCAPGGEPGIVTLEPREPAVQRVTWNGLRSQPGCPGDRTRAEAGTYRVAGRVGDQRATGDSFTLTG